MKKFRNQIDGIIKPILPTIPTQVTAINSKSKIVLEDLDFLPFLTQHVTTNQCLKQ